MFSKLYFKGFGRSKEGKVLGSFAMLLPLGVFRLKDTHKFVKGMFLPLKIGKRWSSWPQCGAQKFRGISLVDSQRGKALLYYSFSGIVLFFTEFPISFMSKEDKSMYVPGWMNIRY